MSANWKLKASSAAFGAWKFGQNATNAIGSAAITSKDWAVKHPGQTAGMVGCVAAAPVAIAVTPLVMGAVGFSASGVVAGSAAAAMQASIGNVAAGSAFAVLQSAAAGGAGLATVNAVVGTTAAAVAAGATAPGLIKAARENSTDDSAENEDHKDEDDDNAGDGEVGKAKL